MAPNILIKSNQNGAGENGSVCQESPVHAWAPEFGLQALT